jgi:hypothetical protein
VETKASSSGANRDARLASRQEGDEDEYVAVKRVRRWSAEAAGDVASPASCRLHRGRRR